MLHQMPPSHNSQNHRRCIWRSESQVGGFNHLEKFANVLLDDTTLSYFYQHFLASAVGHNLCGQSWGICCSGSDFFWPQSRGAIAAAVRRLAVLCGTTPCPQDSRSALAPPFGGFCSRCAIHLAQVTLRVTRP